MALRATSVAIAAGGLHPSPTLGCVRQGTAASSAAISGAAAGRQPRTRRSLFRLQPAACTDDSSLPQEQDWAIGASVWDQRHNVLRGWGQIEAEADPAEDGQRRWQVRWEDQQFKTTTVKQCYLDLSLVRNHKRLPASGLGQEVLVVLGTHKGKAGTTVKKSGTGWSCRLEGEKGLTFCTTDSLHATAPPPTQQVLDAFEPVELTKSPLSRAELPCWLHAYQHDPAAPVDLTRKKPDSHLWYEVLTENRSIDSLTEQEVHNLQYMATGLGSASNSGADDSTGQAVTPSAEAIRHGLHKTAAGRWRIKLVCYHAPQTKCSCPFALECEHDGNGSVTVRQTAPHQFHDPTSLADLAQLKLDETLEALAIVLLRRGVKPAQVCMELNNMPFAGSAPSTSSGGGGLAQFANARQCASLAQIYALRKKMRRDAGFGLTSDPQAVATQMAELIKAGCIGCYQPYKQPDGSKKDAGQPLVIVLQTNFQKRMLNEFGRRLVFLDATGGTNRYGYPFYAMVVVDESGRGVPVGWMICSSDTAEVIQLFLTTLQRGAQEVGKGDFKYGHIMIDKSLTEMAAINLLVLTGDALGWLLCYFHFTQDWERFIRSAESGVVGKLAQHTLMLWLARLACIREQAVFETELKVFYTTHRMYPAVVARMKASWERLADKWAWWGRLDLLDLWANTNNPVERHWGLLKYTDLNRVTQSTIHELVDCLLRRTVPRYITNRGLMLAGRLVSDQQRQVQRAEQVVQHLVDSGAVAPAAATGVPPGLTRVNCRDGGSVKVCVGDLSCECNYSGQYLCVHIMAAAQANGFTPALRGAAAVYLVDNGMIEVDADSGVCSVPALAHFSKVVHCRPKDGFCTCHDCTQHGTCCHLLAAARLPDFEGAVLPAAAYQGDGDIHAPIRVDGLRTFQRPGSEPLGDDHGDAELRMLLGVQRRSAAAIRQGQSNADPAVAELRQDLAYIQRVAIILPEGEQRDELQQAIKDLRGKAEDLAEAAELPLTEQRAGKVVRRQAGRQESDRIVSALLPGRTNTRRRRTLQQQQPVAEADAEAEECSDPFPSLAKKGKAVRKMRGPTVPGNLDGTVIRNGAPHHRRPKRQRLQQ